MSKNHKSHCEYECYQKDCCYCNKNTFDYIVVGAGAAGALIAKNLAQSDVGNFKVLCIEMGENRNDDPLVLLPFSPTTFAPGINLVNVVDDPSTSAEHTSIATTILEPPPGLSLNKDNRVRFRVGRCVGGGSAKNLLAAVHGSPNFHNELAANFTNSGWTNFRDIYRAIEKYTSVDGQMGDCRGTNGPIHILQSPIPSGGPNNIFPEFPAKMAEIAGVALVNDFNDCINTNVFRSGQRFFKQIGSTLVRSFAGNEFLGSQIINQETGKGIDKWKKLQLIVNSTVRKINFSCNNRNLPKAKSVDVVAKGGKEVITYNARNGIILSAGALNTPSILQRSGIGPQDVLNSLGIEPILINENVGKNFMDHAGVVVVIQIDKAIRPNTTVGFGAFLDIESTGVIFGGIKRHVQFTVLNGVSNISPAFVPALNLDFNRFNYITLLCWNLSPISRGTVNIISREAAAYPRIDTQFFNTNGSLNSDIEVCQQTVFYLKNVVDSLNADIGLPAYKIVFPVEEDIDQSNPSLLNNYIAEVTVTDHPSGTTKMDSKNPETAVVNDRLRVIGTQNLICADTSIYPIIPDGNTCMPAYFVGGKLVEFITGKIFNNENPF